MFAFADPVLAPACVQAAVRAGTTHPAAEEVAAVVAGVQPDASAVIALAGDAADAVALEVAQCVAGHQGTPGATTPGDLADLPDLIAATPTAAAWTVPEVESAILTPASRLPQARWVMAVASGSTLSQLAADRLLKAWEEPPASLLVLLAVQDASDLPATLRGRCLAVVHTPMADVAARAAVLSQECGISPAAAAALLEACGSDGRLARQVAHVAPALADGGKGAAELAERRRLADPHTGAGFADASRFASACTTLAALGPTAGRTNARQVAASLLEERAARCRSVALTAPDPRAWLDRAVAAASAAQACRRNAAIPACLAAGLLPPT